ncbi:hyaluronidase-like [Chelonus insularis]|uniref:hyaluronidase-like n=1 Tax=Chelonus insularis TaxID=460826 RepID=UPI00158ECEFB|nr:hyaluronidase-like [Chelonus insularis]
MNVGVQFFDRILTIARIFYEETIKLVRKHRPKAAWAFYDYPVCYNLTPRQPNPQCDDRVKAENDRMAWLWDQSGVLLPSVYAVKAFSKENLTEYINGRLVETYRIANKYYPPKKIFPFLRYRYRDSMKEFLTQDVYVTVFRELLRQNVDGLIIWGSSNDVNTRRKCMNLLNHLHQVLGPLIKSIEQFYPQNKNSD